MSRVVLGVGGGIAAYKACELVRRFTEAGDDVTVVPTAAALRFVGAPTWEALSGHPVTSEVWDDVAEVRHVRLGKSADLVVVAPATADLLARAAAGRADDLLTATLLTARCPVLFVPAMHTEMWLHPATGANVRTLRDRGAVVMEPASGRLTGADSGPGRLPEPEDIHAVATGLRDDAATAAIVSRDLEGLRVVVSAGGTREVLDPVRYLSNASSGRMGIGIARAAALRGAAVTLVRATIGAPVPSGIEVVDVVSTADLADAMTALAPDADIVVMAAAPADFTPATRSDAKIKKDGTGGMTLALVQTPDVLAGLAAASPRARVIVGFAAETAEGDELLRLGTEKLRRKGCDLLVLNDVTAGRVFGSRDNSVVIIDRQGIVARAAGPKDTVAHHILSAARAEIEGEH
ncbi:bifunctional phosphopantothenoylcysteine decarboxylase/phosphopantothenate--cysteine ligase CoaBC [Propionicicella superfundia]|uniref:bifunctional phosphopantothenoylcysteine decarboxylase/phosphopantothenate--cysteine ligase CoaBC n=1 Tax=Propionicicella superfundia TaxID=348582 RepID=UPI000405ABEE|nr:bifunctional phosphopantothenoylcysteine decarboxylase/phosphopantothenate--cysteine ligase CoaBC [Propionicicella superfundia]